MAVRALRKMTVGCVVRLERSLSLSHSLFACSESRGECTMQARGLGLDAGEERNASTAW